MFLASSACADPTEDEERFLKIEGADPSYRVREMETFKKSDFPAGIIDLIQGYDWGSADGSLPARFQGYRLDLNKDGQKEYFIETIYGVALADQPAWFSHVSETNGVSFWIFRVDSESSRLHPAGRRSYRPLGEEGAHSPSCILSLKQVSIERPFANLMTEASSRRKSSRRPPKAKRAGTSKELEPVRGPSTFAQF